jgi:signal transduction histidine kinase
MGQLSIAKADEMRLRQALWNLLSNANKFTDHGTITIDARQREEDGRDSQRPPVIIDIAEGLILASREGAP